MSSGYGMGILYTYLLIYYRLLNQVYSYILSARYVKLGLRGHTGKRELEVGMSNIPIATHQTSPFVNKLYNIVMYIFINTMQKTRDRTLNLRVAL